MAEDYDPEVMRELMGNLDALNASLGPLATRMGQMSGAIDAQGNAINKEGEAIKKAASYREGESKAVQATRQAHVELDKASQHLSQSFTQAGTAATSFADALLAGAGKFSAYNKAIDGAGEAAWQLGKAFGPLGMAIGGAIKAITKVAQVFTEQADQQNEFVAQIKRAGINAGQTSESLTDMARSAGYAAGDLEKLTPIVAKATKNLVGLGGSTSEGTTKLMGMFKAANDNERAFLRIGYSLEELQEVQTGYLDLQRAAGINMTSQNLTQDQLNKRSLDYARNLRVLGELTGKSVEQLQQEQQEATNTFENNAFVLANRVKMSKLEEEIARETNAERKAQLQAERDRLARLNEGTTAAIGELSNRLGSERAQALGKLMRTGILDDSTGALATLGFRAEELKEKFDALATIEDDTAREEARQKLVDEIVQKNADLTGDMVTRLGTSLAVAGEELGKQVGVTSQVMANQVNIMDDVAKQRKEAEAGVTKTMTEGNDEQIDTRAALIDNERKLKTAADELLDSLNPLTGATDATTVAMTALTAAAGIAAGLLAFKSLGGVGGFAKNITSALSKGMGNWGSKMLNVFKGPGASTVANTASTGSRATSALKGLGRLAPKAIPGAAAALSVYEGFQHASQGRERAEQDLAEGKISEQEAGRRKTQATAEGTGKSTGGIGGAAIGAAIGTMILPGIGTVVGGMLGAWLGSEAGEEIGGAIGEKMTISPEMEAQNEANLKIAEQLGIYNENWIGNSEVDMAALEEGIASGQVTPEMIDAMIQDNDLSDEQLQELTDIKANFADIAQQLGAPAEDMQAQQEASQALIDQEQALVTSQQDLTESERANLEKLQERDTLLYNRQLQLLEKQFALVDSQKAATDSFNTSLEGIENMFGLNEEEQEGDNAGADGGSTKGGIFGALARAALGAVPGGNAIASLFSGPGGGGGGGGASSTPGGGAAGGASSTPGGGAAGGASGGPTAEIDPDSSPADRLEQDPAKQQLISSKPDNVKVGPKADLTGVDNQLLAKFFTAAQDYGEDVTVNSAFRGDQYQAQLWVRGRILGEAGIHTPARPKNTTKINYKGKDYTVEGSGRGSKHREGDALDISGNRGALDPFLARYGLVRPYKRKDPPHVEMIKAKEGGMAQGPGEGYLAELHSNEMIVPLEKDSILAKLGKTPGNVFDLGALSSEPLGMRADLGDSSFENVLSKLSNLTSMKDVSESKNIDIDSLTSNLSANMKDIAESKTIDLDLLTSGLTNTMTTSMKDISETGIMDISSIVEKIGKSGIGTEEVIEDEMPTGDAEVYAMLSSKLDTMIEKLDGQNVDMVSVLEKHLAQMVSKLDDSNDLQGKMLQYSKV